MARPIRVAAAGDVHCDEVNRDEIERAFARVEGEVDAILLAGDLTTYGELEQGELLAELCAPLETPIYAVLGNHDWHCNQAAELTAALEAAGVRMIDRGHAIQELDGARLGIAGAKGFVGGFPDSALPDFGEPLLRQVYAETTAEVEALEAGPRRDRGLRLPDRAPALRADREHARGRAARDLRFPRLRPPCRADPRAPPRSRAARPRARRRLPGRRRRRAGVQRRRALAGARLLRLRARRRLGAGRMSTAAPVEVEAPREVEDFEHDRPWIVIVWNDPINLMSYVTLVLQKLFGYSKAKATQLMLQVHNEGKAVVSSGTREKAEHDVARLHAHGLWATMRQD